MCGSALSSDSSCSFPSSEKSKRGKRVKGERSFQRAHIGQATESLCRKESFCRGAGGETRKHTRKDDR